MRKAINYRDGHDFFSDLVRNYGKDEGMKKAKSYLDIPLSHLKEADLAEEISFRKQLQTAMAHFQEEEMLVGENSAREQAMKSLRLLYEFYNIPWSYYRDIRYALTEFETLQDRDRQLESLWAKFADVPMDPETECIEDHFLAWIPGTHREEIWHWFDQRHSKGVAYLLYGSAENYVTETKQLYALSKLCFDCDSRSCQYNHDGECRFSLVHERKPRITEEDGCVDYDYKESEG